MFTIKSLLSELLFDIMAHYPRTFFIPSIRVPFRTPRPLQNPHITKMSLRGRNAVITGATRGIGRGLALAFGEQGANVYITGRTEKGASNSLQSVSAAVRAAGGNCEYFVVDHADDAQIADMFRRLREKLDADGSKLDVFVNNAYAAVGFLKDSMDIPFWQKSAVEPGKADPNADPGKVWDIVNGVGLRNNFVCASHAMRIMEASGGGVIVNISSWGGLVRLFDSVYAIGKSGVDRMSAEIAYAAPENVSCFSFWPGFVSTEDLMQIAQQAEVDAKEKGISSDGESLPIWNAESPLFVGRVLAALVSEKGAALLKQINGKIAVAAEVAELLDINDENGFRSLSFRSVRFFLMNTFPYLRESPLRKLIPRKLYSPWTVTRWVVGSSKFWN